MKVDLDFSRSTSALHNRTITQYEIECRRPGNDISADRRARQETQFNGGPTLENFDLILKEERDALPALVQHPTTPPVNSTGSVSINSGEVATDV